MDLTKLDQEALWASSLLMMELILRLVMSSMYRRGCQLYLICVTDVRMRVKELRGQEKGFAVPLLMLLTHIGKSR